MAASSKLKLEAYWKQTSTNDEEKRVTPRMLAEAMIRAQHPGLPKEEQDEEFVADYLSDATLILEARTGGETRQPRARAGYRLPRRAASLCIYRHAAGSDRSQEGLGGPQAARPLR